MLLKCCKQGCKGRSASILGEGESIKGSDYVNIVAHAHVHLLHPVWTRGLTNQQLQAKKLVTLLTVSLASQEAKYRIYYLCDDDSGNIFSWI